jgi:hypothetical protein
MQERIEEEVKLASTSDAEELRRLVYSPNMGVVSALILNRNLTEELAVIIAKRKNVDSNILEVLAKDVRWKGSYPLKLAICKNPRAPIKTALGLLKHIRIFDLSDLSRDHYIPINLRKKIEIDIIGRIPSLPAGIKKTLAKRVAGDIMMRLLQEEDEEVLSICLNSPYLTEGHLYKVISSPKCTRQLIERILSNTKWSYRYDLKFALMRSEFTPLSKVEELLKGLKTKDIKVLYTDPRVLEDAKPLIENELRSREMS